jgi:hypothetical protein
MLASQGEQEGAEPFMQGEGHRSGEEPGYILAVHLNFQAISKVMLAIKVTWVSPPAIYLIVGPLVKFTFVGLDEYG